MKNCQTNLLFVALSLLIFSGCQKKRDAKHRTVYAAPVQVGIDAFNSSVSYYGTSPESPDGKLIAFVVFTEDTKEARTEAVPGEIWVCNSDLTNYRKVCDINPTQTHNGARVQWVDNQSFLFQDDSIRVVNLQGEPLIMPIAGLCGHDTYDGKFLYAANDPESGLSSIYECTITDESIKKLADVRDFEGLLNHFQDTAFISVPEWRILHLQYNLDGTKIAFRLDIGPRNEHYRHLVTMNYDGSNVQYFGPKPMHFLWYDNETIMGHDLQVDDGLEDDKSLRRWTLDRKVVETLAGPGNHLGGSPDRQYFGSESWYGQDPIVVKVFEKNQTEPLWLDTASSDPHTTWTLAYHTNPSFSRDSKRVYYNKCVGRGKVKVFMAEFLDKK